MPAFPATLTATVVNSNTGEYKKSMKIPCNKLSPQLLKKLDGHKLISKLVVIVLRLPFILNFSLNMLVCTGHHMVNCSSSEGAQHRSPTNDPVSYITL